MRTYTEYMRPCRRTHLYAKEKGLASERDLGKKRGRYIVPSSLCCELFWLLSSGR